MKRFCIAALIVMGLVATGAAQTLGPVESITAAYLEKRVPEELAVKGIVLARHNVALQVEQLANKWLVSLVDLTTGRTDATVVVDALPLDCDAAITAMIEVVARLAVQVVGPSEPSPALLPKADAIPSPNLARSSASWRFTRMFDHLAGSSARNPHRAKPMGSGLDPPWPLPPPSPPARFDDPRERDRREIAELKFKRQSIRFGISSIDAQQGFVAEDRRWMILRGDLDQQINPWRFYRIVGREDLAHAYNLRHAAMIGSYVMAGTTLAVSGVLALSIDDPTVCKRELTVDGHGRCIATLHPSLVPVWIMMGIGVTGIVVGTYFQLRPHPIAECDAKAMADEYNQRLRRQLGLPVVPPEPWLHDVKLTPYVADSNAGLVITGGF